MESVQLLLVDDEPAFLGTMAKRLGRRNFGVRTASGGLEALELLSDGGEEIEVVILDVKMPRMDGIETLTEIKRRHPLVEVIMLTGHGTVGSAIDGMKRGAFDYLMKPCDMKVLENKVREAAERRRRQEKKIVEARVQDLARRAGGTADSSGEPSGQSTE